MVFKKYKFVKYESTYPKLYIAERTKLLKILPKNSAIEHAGSSAVPGLGGKGIIDILIGTKKSLIDKTKKALINGGFIFKPGLGARDRFFFEKYYKVKGKIRRVHIQLTTHYDSVWHHTLLFRDILRKNKDVLKQYALIKRKAVLYAKGNGEKYHNYKSKFIKKILEKWKN